MAEPNAPMLHDRCVLIVEDEYLIAASLVRVLHSRGAEVVGPAGSVQDALAVIGGHGDRLDAAVLDINLRNETVYPVADALVARGVPFFFLTGYDARIIPESYAGVPRCEKPISSAQLARMLSSIGLQ